jgi:hypothetical protein
MVARVPMDLDKVAVRDMAVAVAVAVAVAAVRVANSRGRGGKVAVVLIDVDRVNAADINEVAAVEAVEGMAAVAMTLVTGLLTTSPRSTKMESRFRWSPGMAFLRCIPMDMDF